jgi:hypothetical protein
MGGKCREKRGGRISHVLSLCAAMKERKFYYIQPLATLKQTMRRGWEIIIQADKSIHAAGEMKFGAEY